MIETKTRTVLCIAHPGHELRVFGWMGQNRPLVYVITDGSGPNRASRFESTRLLIEEAGGRLGFLAGAFSDRSFYEMISEGDPEPFIDLARRFAADWEAAGVEVVAGDMLEGFSTTHDLCRMMINAAVEKLRRQGRSLTNLEFALESMTPPEITPGSVVISLDDTDFARKRHAALAAYPQLASEVERLISQYGEGAFRNEVLLPATVPAGLTWDDPKEPFYETYGRKQIAAGHYQHLISYQEHIQPLARALWDWALSDRK